MPNPVRLLSPASIGQQKSRHENSLFFSPAPYPCHVRAQAVMKPRHHGRQSCLCLCPAPISFMPRAWQWLGTLAYLAHTNKHFKIRVITNNCNNLLIITKLSSESENAADFSPQKDQNMKQVGWQESYVTCKQAVLNIILSRLWETAFGYIVMKVWIYARSPVVKLMI